MVDRLEMRPEKAGYSFAGTGTLQPLIDGLIPSSTTHLEWRPHRVPLGCGLLAGSQRVSLAGLIPCERKIY